MNLYNSLMESVIYEDSTEEYKERVLQEKFIGRSQECKNFEKEVRSFLKENNDINKKKYKNKTLMNKLASSYNRKNAFDKDYLNKTISFIKSKCDVVWSGNMWVTYVNGAPSDQYFNMVGLKGDKLYNFKLHIYPTPPFPINLSLINETDINATNIPIEVVKKVLTTASSKCDYIKISKNNIRGLDKQSADTIVGFINSKYSDNLEASRVAVTNWVKINKK